MKLFTSDRMTGIVLNEGEKTNKTYLLITLNEGGKWATLFLKLSVAHRVRFTFRLYILGIELQLRRVE